MKRALTAVLVAALLVPAAATAKGGPGETARLVYTPAPAGLKAGTAWNVRFRFFMQNGRPWLISGLRPWVTVKNPATGTTRRFTVRQADSTYYAARIVFPSSGTWTVTFDFGREVPAGSRRLAAVKVG